MPGSSPGFHDTEEFAYLAAASTVCCPPLAKIRRQVREKRNEGLTVGSFYTDLEQRLLGNNGAGMDICREHRETTEDGSLQSLLVFGSSTQAIYHAQVARNVLNNLFIYRFDKPNN